MRLQSEDGRVTLVLGDTPQDQKRAKILLADRWVALSDAPVVADAEGAPATSSETPSEFAGLTKTDLVAHLEAAGCDPKELKALKKDELVVLAQQAADAEAAKKDGEEETKP